MSKLTDFCNNFCNKVKDGFTTLLKKTKDKFSSALNQIETRFKFNNATVIPVKQEQAKQE